jgi:hypothetical protein
MQRPSICLLTPRSTISAMPHCPHKFTPTTPCSILVASQQQLRVSQGPLQRRRLRLAAA